MPDHDGERPEVACYLHPRRPALVRCSRCERPICADDLIEAPVGYQCPRCAEGGRPVRRLPDLGRADVTRVLVIAVAVLFLVSEAVPGLVDQFALRPLVVALGQPWLLVTSALLHASLMHVGFNGLLLWQLGHLLEPALGTARYVALCAAGLAGGAFGVVLLAWVSVATPLGSTGIGQWITSSPGQPTVGASGMVFGLMGAALVGLRNRGVDPWRSGIGALVVLNLVITFAVPYISVGGHLGGLLGGAGAGTLLFVDRSRARRATLLVTAVSIGLLAAAVWLADLTLRAVV